LPNPANITIPLKSQGNVSERWIDEPDPLSLHSEEQAKTLGEQWANVHIDHLFSSKLQHAVQTAQAISTHNNTSHPPVEETDKIVEHYIGERAIDYLRRGAHRSARYERAGSYYDLPERDFRPRGGGESYEDVAERAREFVENDVLARFGVALDEVSKDLEKKPKKPDMDRADELPDGIPHVAMVTNNIFITELFEGLSCWNTNTHKNLPIQWGNADW
jgi:Histidine phosphatase superfamily (branch 1)